MTRVKYACALFQYTGDRTLSLEEVDFQDYTIAFGTIAYGKKSGAAKDLFIRDNALPAFTQWDMIVVSSLADTNVPRVFLHDNGTWLDYRTERNRLQRERRREESRARRHIALELRKGRARAHASHLLNVQHYIEIGQFFPSRNFDVRYSSTFLENQSICKLILTIRHQPVATSKQEYHYSVLMKELGAGYIEVSQVVYRNESDIVEITFTLDGEIVKRLEPQEE